MLEADNIVLATGAMERSMPFPGWTKAGVMGVGAGQVLLKDSALLPDGNVVLAGSGPLLYLLAWQYLQAGLRVSAIVETTPRSNLLRALPHLPGALRANAYLRKGLDMLRAIRRGAINHFRGATALRALGDEQVASLLFESGGRSHEIPCALLLLHQGVVPNVQVTRSLGIEHDWEPLQRCWRPRVTAWGETAIEGIYVAGDGGGIGGAQVAEHQGRLTALHAARRLGGISVDECESRARPVRRRLAHHLAVRPFLDALYSPAREFLCPADETIVCRCEEVDAGSIREYVRLGCLGPNQTKAFGRPGMGPCQGRVCGLAVSELIAEARGLSPADVGYYRVRPPIKPVTLGQLAAVPLPDEQKLETQDIG
jgi:NADPH-dependent 2,4-dienoyl-CoA reductase/sulfur reductase-like enzyme